MHPEGTLHKIQLKTAADLTIFTFLLLFFYVLEYKRQLSTLREEESPVIVSDSECVSSVCDRVAVASCKTANFTSLHII